MRHWWVSTPCPPLAPWRDAQLGAPTPCQVACTAREEVPLVLKTHERFHPRRRPRAAASASCAWRAFWAQGGPGASGPLRATSASRKSSKRADNSVRPFCVVPRRGAAAARPVSAGRARRIASRARRGGKSKEQRRDNVTATERCEKGSETINAGNGAARGGAGGAERGASGGERGRRRAQSTSKLARLAPGRAPTARGPRASCGAVDPMSF